MAKTEAACGAMHPGHASEERAALIRGLQSQALLSQRKQAE
jgi:hypothetical protein